MLLQMLPLFNYYFFLFFTKEVAKLVFNLSITKYTD